MGVSCIYYFRDKTFPREDYLELCQLSVVFLGETVEGFKFQRPGAIHHARFMAKSLYYLKMALLLPQTALFHQKEIREINVMAEFIAIFHCKWWFLSPLPTAAPSEDLISITVMRQYEKINPEVAVPCLQSIYRHLEYLTQELVVLSLSHDHLPDAVRKGIAAALHETVRTRDLPSGKPKPPKLETMQLQGGIDCLKDFVGENSWTIPNLLNLTDDDMVWLQLEVHQWPLLPGYRKFERFARTLSVVNDSAERVIKRRGFC